MANTPQKSHDATDEALSAVKDALQASEAGYQGADRRRSQPLPPPVAADLFHEEMPEPQVRRHANDDRAAIGQILQVLQRRPARTPYFVATFLTVAWAAGAAAAGYFFRDQVPALLAQPVTGIAALVGFGCAVLIPILSFYIVAHMLRRSQDLRLVSQSMAEVALRLAEPETAAHESITTVGQAIRREVAAMGDGVERALARAAELEALVHNEVSALERAYNDNEVRIRDLLTELANQRDTLVNQAEQVRNAIASVHLGLSHDITSVGDIVAERVQDVAQRVTRSLTEKGEHITLALGHAGDSMIDALSERGGNLLERLETTSDRATTAISSASDRLSNSLTFKTDNIHEEFSELSVRLQQMMASRLDQVTQNFGQRSSSLVDMMANRSQQITDSIVDTGGRMVETIAARVDEVNSTLRSTGDSLVLDLSLRGGDVVSKMEQTSARITDTIISQGSKVASTFENSAENLVTSINARGDEVRDMLSTRLQAFETMFNQGGTELSEKISRDTTSLGSLITRNISEFDRTVKTYGGELVERLGQRTTDVSEAMRTYVDSFDSRVTARGQEVGTALDQRLTAFEQQLDGRVNALTSDLLTSGREVVDSISQRVADVGGIIDQRGSAVAQSLDDKIEHIDTTLGARATEVANTLDSRIGRFEELLVGRAEAVTEQIEVRSKAAAEALNARMEQLTQAIKVNAGEAEQSLGQLALTTTDAIRNSANETQRSLNDLSSNVSATLKQNAEDVERTLTNVSGEVARNFVGKADEIAATVAARAEEMTSILSDRSGSVLDAITQKSQEFSAEVGKATDQAVKSIEEKGLAFTQAMMDNSSEISRMINSAGENASNTVNRTLNELQATTQAAIERSKATATATVSEMLETHEMLRSDTTTLFERLREANIMLQEVLSGTHENMSALENTMMLRVSEFVGAMSEVTDKAGAASDRVEQNIAGFRDVTARIVNDLGGLANQFNSHGRDLATAVELLERSNQRTEDTLNERRISLESLVATLDIRTEDLDQRLKRFSALLDESLDAASQRARDVARMVSETSAEGGHIVAEQFERMRATAEEERLRTADSMRAIFEQSTSDTQTIFNEAGQRFAEVVQDMKQMSAAMQRELEATRAEMRRGVLELPQETTESASKMRRVIVDQIEALAELNRIVARHGRHLDTVEPARPAQQPSFAAAAGSRESFQPAPRQPAPQRPERNELPGFMPSAQPRRNETPSAAPAANKGWLTDLLKRAERDDEEPVREMPRESVRQTEDRSPRHSIESLDSLSVDIARMIDHEAAADLWDRYKRGERNVFTRRLYTLQGQRAFDEIRQKYRGNREFKQTVDRYIGEFERLLEEVSRDDRGQVVARTYLTSETGKVYTMLAHAAGRFE